MTPDERLDRLDACTIEATLAVTRAREALAAVRHHARELRAELGYGPGPALHDLELDPLELLER